MEVGTPTAKEMRKQILEFFYSETAQLKSDWDSSEIIFYLGVNQYTAGYVVRMALKYLVDHKLLIRKHIVRPVGQRKGKTLFSYCLKGKCNV